MFGANEIVGQKYFKDNPKALTAEALPRLLVTSIFLTLQGEGPFMGRPAVFIRLAKCNLACSFCDTYFDTGDWMSIRQIMDKTFGMISDKYGAAVSRIGFVITGGEPTLQEPVVELCTRLAEAGAAFVQVESNGILTRPGLEGPGVSLVVSPKCLEPRSGKQGVYLKPHSGALAQAVCLKFVVSADERSAYHTIPEWAHEWTCALNRPIYISPMNTYAREPAAVAVMREGRAPTLEERNRAELVSFWTEGLLDRAANKANHEYAAQYALDHGYNLSLQMHLYAGVA